MVLGLAMAAGILLPSHGARAAIALVNEAATSGGATQTLSATLSVSSSNLLVVECDFQNTSVEPAWTVSDTAGNTFFKIVSVPNTQASTNRSLWYAKNTLRSAADTVTCDFGQTFGDINIMVLQYSGVDPLNPLDVQANGLTYSSNAVTSSAFSTAAPNEVIVTCAGSPGVGPYTAGTGYAIRIASGTDSACEDETVSALQSNAVAAMYSGTAGNLSMVVGTFRAFTQGVQVSNRSDTLSNSQPSATLNQTIAFTVNSAVHGSSVSGSSTINVNLDPAFTMGSSLDCGDVDAATSSQFNFNYPGCAATATAWGSPCSLRVPTSRGTPRTREPPPPRIIPPSTPTTRPGTSSWWRRSGTTRGGPSIP